MVYDYAKQPHRRKKPNNNFWVTIIIAIAMLLPISLYYARLRHTTKPTVRKIQIKVKKINKPNPRHTRFDFYTLLPNAGLSKP